MGANGSGKSTFFKLLSKNLKPRAGSIRLLGRDLADYRQMELARTLAVVWQHNTAPYDITVRNLVAYGRIPHRRAFATENAADTAAIERALEFCDLADLAEQRMAELSGGQQQRVWIALGLAQESPIMLLDEPTTFLDIAYQAMILRLVQRLRDELDRTIVLILHDVNQAIAVADRIVALEVGGRVTSGTPAELTDEQFLRRLYGTDLRVLNDGEHRFIATL
jgi:iron complex transport system ATP-binding protein